MTTAAVVPPMMREMVVELVSIITRDENYDRDFAPPTEDGFRRVARQTEDYLPPATEDGFRRVARQTNVEPPNATEDDFRRVACETGVDPPPATEDGFRRVTCQTTPPDCTKDIFRRLARETSPPAPEDRFRRVARGTGSPEATEDCFREIREITAGTSLTTDSLYLCNYVPVSVDGKCGEKINQTCVDSPFGKCCSSDGMSPAPSFMMTSG